MPLAAGYDIETTGLLTPDHRIIEVYVGLWDTTTRKQVFTYEQRIDPERSIAADAQRVHGISAADLSGKPVWSMVAPALSKVLSKADFVIGHNIREFDWPFTNQELRRVGLPALDKPLVDTMLEGRWAKPDGTVPNLGALCWACEVDYDPANAHAASYDVQVMVEAYFRALDWGFFKPFNTKDQTFAAQAA
jgi:DNA polymerase-3 subunit epsilon